MKSINVWRHLIEIFQNDKLSAARQALILSSIIFLMGCFFIIGTALKWSFLVDPEEWGPFRQFYTIKKKCGSKDLISYLYLMGFLFVFVSGYFIISILGGAPVTWKK